ncbi:MAG: AAA family ATPase [Meiothermus sp.]|nr:AAA family ATPase [Meiothermus sp.]
MRLHLLGQPRVVSLGEGRPVLGYGALVLAWLALHQRADALPSRLRLARALWPDEDDDQARRRLTNTLYRLKRDFPELEGRLIGDAHTLGLGGVELDTVAFGQKMRGSDPAGWLEALELYSGDLLEDSDAPWLEEWRADLRELFLIGLQRLLEHQNADPAAATRTAQRWVSADPLSEEAHTALIRLYAAQGRSAEALAQYQTLEQTLERELGTMPRPQTQAFARSLRPGDQSYRPLVGRTNELRALADQLAALKAGRGGIVLLEGEPGVGKSRLLEEAAQLARWHRLAVLRGTASQQHQTPYAPLDLALQGSPSLLEAASPLIRETLRPLLEAGPETALNSSSSAVGAALERWLHRLGEPLALLLDDAQWAGDLFWALLPVLGRLARQQQVLLVLSYRSHELHSEPFALEALGNLRREGAVLHLELARLNLEECAAMAKGFGKTLDAAELDRLYRLSGGNPLVYLELLSGQSADGHLEGLLQTRLAQLKPHLRRALEAGSVLGTSPSRMIWEAMIEAELPALALEESRFVLQTAHGLSFQHDLMRVFIYQQMSEATRKAWHSKAFEVLKPYARAANLAFHAEAAGRAPEAIAYLCQAGEEALKLGSSREAKKYVERVFGIRPFDPNRFDGSLFRARIVQLKLNDEMRLSTGYLEEVEHLEQLALAEGRYDIVASLFGLKIAAYESRGDAQGFNEASGKMLELARQVGDPRLEIEATHIVALKSANTFYKADAALPLALRALSLCDTSQVAPGMHFEALCTVMICHLRQNHNDLARPYLERLKGLLEKHPELELLRYRALFFEHFIATNEGRDEDALPLREAELEMHRTMGNPYGVSATLQNLISTLKQLGQYRAALVWAEELAERAQAHTQNVEPHMLATHLARLASLHALLGQTAEAEQVLRPIMDWLLQGGTGPGAVSSWEALGQLHLARCAYAESYAAYMAAIRLRDNPRASQSWFLHAAHAACLAGNRAESEACLERFEALQNSPEARGKSVLWHLVDYLLHEKPASLEEARQILFSAAGKVRNPSFRNSILLEIPHHRTVCEHWQRQDLQTLTALLPASDGSSKVSVVWTLCSGASDKQRFAEGGKVGLRHHRIRRLVLEAAVQGAVPTQADLAEALGVTLRTLEADLAALREQGIELKTLGMRREIAH